MTTPQTSARERAHERRAQATARRRKTSKPQKRRRRSPRQDEESSAPAPVNPYAPPAAEAVAAGGEAGWLRGASKASRLANALADTIVCIVIVIPATFASILFQLDAMLVALGVPFFYYFISEAAFGRTVGKLLTGTRVVMEDGQPAQAGPIFVRTLVRWVPFDAVSFIGHGWHDTWSKTRVVYVKSLRTNA